MARAWALVYILLQLSSSSSVHGSLPAGCRLGPGDQLVQRADAEGFFGPGLMLFCKKVALGSLEALDSVHSDLVYVALAHTGLTELSGTWLNRFPNLERLGVAHNSIRSIGSYMFVGLTKLQNLGLNSNQLLSIEAGAFKGLTNLKHLNLANNDISVFPPDLFKDLTQLTFLYLANNKLTSVPSGIFNELHNLERLDLSNNFLTYLPSGTFRNATKLNTLLLNSNDLREFGPGFFSPLKIAVELSIGDNDFDSIDVTAFVGTFSESALGGFRPWYFSSSHYTFEDTIQALRLNLSGTPFLHTGALESFTSLPQPVSIILTEDGSGDLLLSSCCGLEWLVSGDIRYQYVNGTVECWHPREGKKTLEELRDRVICPCMLDQTNGQRDIFRNTPEECEEISAYNLINNECKKQPCGNGTRLIPLTNLPDAVVSCSYPNPFGVGYENVTIVMAESECQSCLISHCNNCDGSATICQECSDNYYLLNGNCLVECPAGYKDVDAEGDVGNCCEACTSANCNECATATSTCTQCRNGLYLEGGSCVRTCVNSPPSDTSGKLSKDFGVIGLECAACQVSGCQLCFNDVATCTQCNTGLFLNGNECVTECPRSTNRQGSSCVSNSSANQTPIIIGAVIGSLLLLALLWVVLARAFQKKQTYLSRELDMQARLLDESQQQVEAMKQAWRISEEDVTLVKQIDHGSQGSSAQVWLGTWGTIAVAVKKMRLPYDMTGLNETFEREVAFMQQVRHPCVVLFFGAGTTSQNVPFLVFEYMSRGSLMTILHEPGTIQWDVKIKWIRNIVQGMSYIHSLGRLHRDLKSANILVGDNGRAKVADFGTSVLLDMSSQQPRRRTATQASRSQMTSFMHSYEEGMLTQGVGSPLWMAPEVIQSAHYTFSADVYSFAILAWEICTQLLPWCHIEGPGLMMKIYNAVKDGQRPDIPEDTPITIRTMIEQGWVSDPEMRPSFQDIADLLPDAPSDLDARSEANSNW